MKVSKATSLPIARTTAPKPYKTTIEIVKSTTEVYDATIYTRDQCGSANKMSNRKNHIRSNFNTKVGGNSNKVKPRIVGGKPAKFGAWPWVASLSYGSSHFCGGALLNQNWIATAAHCMDGKSVAKLLVKLGELNFANLNKELPFVERKIERRIIHPAYRPSNFENDLALLKLESPIQYSAHIQPICLPISKTDDLVGRNASVIGWGKKSNMGQRPKVLQEVYVPIISNQECIKMFNKSGMNEWIPNNFLCAGYSEGGRDACQGDSGGPLQVRGSDNKWFLAGITSWGHGCGDKNSPGVYTRVSKFSEWILEKIYE